MSHACSMRLTKSELELSWESTMEALMPQSNPLLQLIWAKPVSSEKKRWPCLGKLGARWQKLEQIHIKQKLNKDNFFKHWDFSPDLWNLRFFFFFPKQTCNFRIVVRGGSMGADWSRSITVAGIFAEKTFIPSICHFQNNRLDRYFG